MKTGWWALLALGILGAAAISRRAGLPITVGFIIVNGRKVEVVRTAGTVAV